MDKFIPNRKPFIPSEHFVNQSVKPQMSEEILWYPFINFGHEIKFKRWLYLVLLD